MLFSLHTLPLKALLLSQPEFRSIKTGLISGVTASNARAGNFRMTASNSGGSVVYNFRIDVY